MAAIHSYVVQKNCPTKKNGVNVIYQIKFPSGDSRDSCGTFSNNLYRNRDWGNPYNPKLNTHIEENWKSSYAAPVLHESQKVVYQPKPSIPPRPSHTSVQIPMNVPALDFHAAGATSGCVDRFHVWSG